MEAIESRQYDVCLLDYYLGQHTGLELLRAFLENGYKGPVIMLTGLGDQQTDIRAMEAGAADYLIKGEINPYLLERTIRYSVRHRQILQKLQQREERFRSLVQNSSDVIAVLTIEGGVRYVSDSCRRIFGYAPHALMGESILDFIHPDDRLRAKEAFSELVDSPDDTLSVEFRFQNANGTWRILEATASNLLDHPSVEGVVANARDVTDQRQAEDKVERYAARLERSNRDLENFAYVISHDLREPLRMVTSFLRLLEQRYEGRLDAKGKEYVDYAVDGAARMRAMIDALLDLSRVKTRGRPFEEVDTEEVLVRTLRVLARAVEESGAEVTHDPLPAVLGDAAQLAQLFQNLIANAIKFGRDEVAPHVHISVVPACMHAHPLPPSGAPHREESEGEGSGFWCFSVRDNGIGIDAGQADRIFEIFQRLHTEEEYPGLGMGLALCKRIVERHHGQIWVESAVGEGSTFYFTLPKAESRIAR
jgi:PAS domain S-box-containing protein